MTMTYAGKVAVLGPRGSHSVDAALKRFNQKEIDASYSGFGPIVDAVAKGQASYGVLPIENYLEGLVQPVLSAIRNAWVQGAEIFIRGEISHTIRHVLAGNPQGEKLYVQFKSSEQCQRRIDELRRKMPHLQIEQVSSTSKAAELAKQNKGMGVCSEGAAFLYDVPILETGIDNNPDNKTRFWIVSREQVRNEPTGDDITSSIIDILDKPGALVRALLHLPYDVEQQGDTLVLKPRSQPVNMRALHSHIDNGTAYFLVDVEGHIDQEPLRGTWERVRRHTVREHLLGSYPKEYPLK